MVLHVLLTGFSCFSTVFKCLLYKSFPGLLSGLGTPRNADFQFGLGAPKGILGLIGAGEFQDIDRAWTAAVGVEILTLFIFSLSSEAVSALSVLYFKLSCWLLGRQKQSWKEMKALYTPADFELALHQASQLSATCAALMYASCLPLLYLLLALRLFLMYWSAKFELLRGSQVPKRFSHVLAMASCRWVQVGSGTISWESITCLQTTTRIV